MKKFGTVVNVDSDFLWYIYEGNGKTVANAKKQLKEYIDYYAGHNISDIVFCIFAQSSVAPSKKWSWFGDKLSWKEEAGIAVDYSNHPRLVPYYEYYTNGECDPIEYLLKESKKMGMNPWISFRMNDTHFPHDATSFLRGKEYYGALSKKEQRVYGNRNDYFDGTFNYEDETVRELMLSYINEQVERYDAYGIELDFQREITCFQYWEKPTEYYCNIMNEFIRKVKGCLFKREKTVGHKIKLMIRLTRDIEQNRVFGFDARTWVKEGLIDVLVPTPRWLSTDSDMPIKEWVEMVKGTKTEIYAGQERQLAYDISSKVLNTLETAKGFASAYFKAGADKTYLFNFFNSYNRFKISPVFCENPSKIWEDVSSPEKSNEGTRRFVVTYQESDIVPKGYTPYKPLPKEIEDKYLLSVQLGEVSSNDKVRVYLVIENDANNNVNGILINGFKLKSTSDTSGIYINKDMMKGKILAFEGKGDVLMSGKVNLEFSTVGKPTLKYVEVCIG